VRKIRTNRAKWLATLFALVVCCRQYIHHFILLVSSTRRFLLVNFGKKRHPFEKDWDYVRIVPKRFEKDWDYVRIVPKRQGAHLMI
jgi:hypothetical protein